MKFWVSIGSTIIVSFAAGMYLPFWSIALVAFTIAAFIGQKPGMAWLAGFISIFLFWGLLAWWIHSQNNGILTQRMATLFPLGGSSQMLILITALVGAIIGGLSALSGSYLRKYLDDRKLRQEEEYY